MPPIDDIDDPFDAAIYSSDALEIASDATYGVQGDSKDGTDTKITPALGVITQGARPARQLPAQHENWWKNQITSFLTQLHDDTEGLRAALVTIFGERMTDWLSRWGQSRPLSILLSGDTATLASVSWSQAKRAIYDRSNRRWVAMGAGASGAVVIFSDNAPGAYWNDISTGDPLNGFDIACDGIGDLLMTTAAPDVFFWDITSLTWTSSVTGVLDIDSDDLKKTCKVSFDRVHNKWIWIGHPTASPLNCKVSSNGTTWSSGGGGGVFSGTDMNLTGNTCHQIHTTDAGVTLVVAFKPSDNTVKIVKSTDGGTTWTNAGGAFTTNLAGTGQDADTIALAYDEDNAAWYVAVGPASGGGELWRSTDDGATFTKMAGPFLANAKFRSLACFRECIVACLYQEEAHHDGDKIAFSSDNGATWHYAGVNIPTGQFASVAAGNGRVAVLQKDGVFYLGAGAGNPDAFDLGP